MANRFLNNIRINDEYTLPAADGTADQIIVTDGAGQLSFVNQDTINSGSAERTEILVKNVHGSALSKGDPVYIVGSVGASAVLEVALADAGNAAKMPCVGLLTQDLANNGEGTATVTGKLRNLITSPIDGATPSENDTLYVKSGGGLTLTKPTGSANLIQNVGQVGRVSTSADGNIVVSAILRSNDVPNLPTGKIWVGTTANTAASGVVHLDEGNSRMGINTTSPSTALDVNGSIQSVSGGTFGADNLAGSIYMNVSNQGLLGKFSTYARNLIKANAFQVIEIGHNSSLVSGIELIAGSAAVNGYINLKTKDSSRLYVSPAGNIGIGTTSPGDKLHVVGNIYLGTSNQTIYTTSTANVNLQTGTGAIKVLTDNGATTIADFQNAGSLQLAQYGSGTFTGTATQRLGVDSSGNVIEIPIGSGAVDGSGTANYVTKWSDSDTITNSIIYDNGTNVGIGTTSPGSKLDVSGGDIRLSTNATYLRSKDSASAIPRVLGMNASNAFYIGPIDSYAGGGIIYGASSNVSYHGFYGGGSEKVRITSSGNVGIGTTSPATTLQVYNSTEGQYMEIGAGDGGGRSLVFTSSSNNGSVGALHTINAKSVNGVIALATANSERMRIDSSGNVGIGTTSPNHLLDVEKAGASARVYNLTSDGNTDLYLLTAGTTGSSRLLFGDTADNDIGKIIYRNNGDSLAFETNAGERMRITSTGNVGIGTTSPSAKLQVNSGSGDEVIRLDHGSATGNPYISFYQNGTRRGFIQQHDSSDRMNVVSEYGPIALKTGTGGTETTKIEIATNGAIQFNNYGSGTFTGTATQRLGVDSSGNVIEIPIGSGAVDGSGTANYVTKWSDTDTITNSVIYDNGTNVGIGTTSPLGKLHVENSTVRSSVNGGADNIVIEENGYSGITILSNNANAGQIHFGDQDAENTGMIQYFHSDNSMRFATGNATEKMRIDSSGNVGIGTTSPSVNLHVESATSAQFKVGNGTQFVRLYADADEATILADGSVDMRFYTGGSEKMRIDTSGNVGIGTTSPTSKLHLSTNDSVAARIIGANSSYTSMFIGNTATGAATLWLDAANGDLSGSDYAAIRQNNDLTLELYSAPLAGDLIMTPGGTERMRVKKDGNVGIDTTSPTQKLHVSGGNILIGSNNYDLRGRDTGGNDRTLVRINSSNEAEYGWSGAGPVKFMGGGSYTERMRIHTNGYVGIGETNPTSSLEVNGDIRVKNSGRLYLWKDNSSNYIDYNNWIASTGATQSIQNTGAGGISLKTGTSTRLFVAGGGNVGIGTTSPSAALDVKDLVQIDADGSYGGYGTVGFGGLTNGWPRIFGSPSNKALFIASGTGNSIFFRAGGGTTSHVTIENTGDVGINTTNPTQLLHIAGASATAIATLQRTNATTTGSYGALQWTASDDHTVAAIDARGDGDNEGAHLLFHTTSAAASNDPYGINERMRITSDGNVGIGTTSPDYKLDVAGTIGMDTYLVHNGDDDTFIGYSANDTFDVNAGGVKQLSVTSDNVNITDTLSYTYPTATGQYNGEIVTFGTFYTTNGTIAAGDVIVYTQAGLNTGWFRATGNTTYGKGMLGIAMGTTPSAGILIKGFARNAAFTSGNGGDPLYISATSAGDTTSTPPSSTNNVVRIVGYMLNPTNDEIFFDPDKSWVQVS